MIRKGTKEFHEICRITHKKFEMIEDEKVPFTFFGFQVFRENLKRIKMDQNKYLDMFKQLHIDSEF